jgi:hypothetical protein
MRSSIPPASDDDWRTWATEQLLALRRAQRRTVIWLTLATASVQAVGAIVAATSAAKANAAPAQAQAAARYAVERDPEVVERVATRAAELAAARATETTQARITVALAGVRRDLADQIASAQKNNAPHRDR